MSFENEDELNDKVSQYFKEIISKIENLIEENSDKPETVLMKIKLISQNITGIFEDNLDNATKDQYEMKIKELQNIIEKQKAKEIYLKNKLESVESKNSEILTPNTIKSDEALTLTDQIIYKLKKKLKEKEELFKYKEILYLSRINELNKKLKREEKNSMNTISTNNEVYTQEEINKCELFPNKKKTVSLDMINNKPINKRKQNGDKVVKNYSVSNISNHSSTWRKDKIFSKSLSDLRLYELYQKNRNKKTTQNNFLIQSNLIGIRNIIESHNQNIVPPYPFKKPIKNYYSAFVKDE